MSNELTRFGQVDVYQKLTIVNISNLTVLCILLFLICLYGGGQIMISRAKKIEQMKRQHCMFSDFCWSFINCTMTSKIKIDCSVIICFMAACGKRSCDRSIVSLQKKKGELNLVNSK